jgi:hypothetical protein
MSRLVCFPVAMIAAITCQLALAQALQGGASATTGPAKPRQLTIQNKEWTGDFARMLERRMIRVYAPFSRSLYFNDNGHERGIAVEHRGISIHLTCRRGSMKIAIDGKFCLACPSSL